MKARGSAAAEVEAVDVEAIDVEAIDVEAIEVEAIEVEAMRKPGSHQTTETHADSHVSSHFLSTSTAVESPLLASACFFDHPGGRQRSVVLVASEGVTDSTHLGPTSSIPVDFDDHGSCDDNGQVDGVAASSREHSLALSSTSE